MEATVERGWRSRVCPPGGVADALLLWAPVFLMAVDRQRDLFSATTRGLAMLAIAVGVWAAGRGAAAGWAEGVFAGGWLLLWSGALTVALSSARLLSAASAALGLGVGAALLAWAWRQRRSRRKVDVAERARVGVLARSGWKQVASSAAVLAFLTLAPIRPPVPPVDLIVYAVSLALYLLLSVEGRTQRPAGAAR
jgi:hypothetical protein